MTYNLNPLRYGYDELEPYIDGKTLEIHHGAHHKTYLEKFNNAIVGTEFENQKIENILGNLDKLPENIKTIVKNNGGGYYNHNIYFDNMKPGGSKIPNELEQLINKSFQSLNEFKQQFTNIAITTFGSGRACLAKDGDNLVIYSLQNQDTALIKGHIPLLMLDVWEHAYYLKHQNRRPNYINDWWNIINWDNVMDLYKNYKI